MQRRRRDDRRSGRRFLHARQVRRRRAGGAALRVQGRAQRVSRRARRRRSPARSLADAHRVQRAEPRPRDAVLRPGAVPPGAEAKGRSPSRTYRTALAKSRRLARTEGHRRGVPRSTGSTRSSRRPAARPGSPTWSTATTSPAAAPRRRPSPATRSITVPAGFVVRPAGRHLVLRPARSEATLIKFAHAFEQATNARHKPAFLPTADIASPTR